ncbi:MAG: hypothetical protein K6B74_03410 [Ruminococcus sp.]|nr:hypothetical protein [Ruminococcus sp.]
MSNVSIGITAMELFAYNPFRILGLPVNASHAEISGTYEMLLKMADSGDIGSYTTPFDFDSLPPFSRSGQTVKTAHAKLASNGYRCFAYADSEFSASLNIDDITLNLRSISCYDCFLRCYMWLVINDRNLEEHDLWIQLATYIDKMIMSSPDEWTKYFDHRFPDEMVDENLNVYKSFYTTFCDIILLPLKEMVRGSMKCHSALDILKCAKINIDERFDYVNIPQANSPKPGEPEPKLKLARKYGDEYYDSESGSMKSYSEGSSNATESNSFAASESAPLDAEDILSDDNAPAASSDNASASGQSGDEQESSSRRRRRTPRRSAPAAEPEQPAQSFSGKSRAERRAEKEAESAAAAASAAEKKAPAKTELVAPKVEPLKLEKEGTSAAAKPEVPKQPAAPKPRRSFNRGQVSAEEDLSSEPAVSSGEFVNPFSQQSDRPDPIELDNKAASAVRMNSFNAVVEEAARKEAEAAAAMYEEEEEEITNTLIDLLKSSSHGVTMKGVDTSHIVSAAEMAGASHTKANMDAIDFEQNYDASRLGSQQNMERKMTREERYRNVKIDDMLSGQAQGKNYGITAIDQFKKNKAEQKQTLRSLFITMGFVAIVILVFLGYFFLGF